MVLSALCANAIDGGLGTMSEMALTLQWQLPELATLGAPWVPRARYFHTAALALEATAVWLATVEDTDVRDLGG